MIDREQPTTLYAGVGVLKSADAGSTWFPSSEGMPEGTMVFALIQNPDQTNIIYAGTRRGLNVNSGGTVYKTTNAGTTWTEAGSGLPDVWITSLSINPDTTKVICAGTWKEGVFRSTDGGITWSEMNEGLPEHAKDVEALAIDPFDPRTIYIGTCSDYLFECGVFAYTDTTLHGVEPLPGGILPRECFLSQNYPNPFNSNTAISYQLSGVSGRPSAVTLRVYNILGQLVRTLVDDYREAGYYKVCWNGRDDLGKEVSSGVYFYRLEVKNDRLKITKVRKMILLR